MTDKTQTATPDAPTLDIANAIAAAAEVHKLGSQARSLFIDRDEAIRAMELALIAGQHVVMLGPPGTAKSAIVRFFASGLGIGFFRKLLNPDTKRDELVGPLSPTALKQGKWDRAWAGLATNEVVFLDEIGKASGQVQNMVLDAMEERVVTSGSGDIDIPLHVLVSATNETLSEEQEAVWDRFTLRVVVGYLDTASKFAHLLSCNGTPPNRVNLGRNDLANMRAACAHMAAHVDTDVIEAMVKLWSDLGTITTERVSDRRWLRVLTVAAASALLAGRDHIEVPDLAVATYMLWQAIDEKSDVEAFVLQAVNPDRTEYQAALVLVEELETAFASTSKLEDLARIAFRSEQLLRSVGSRPATDQADWDEIRSRLSTVKEGAFNAR